MRPNHAPSKVFRFIALIIILTMLFSSVSLQSPVLASDTPDPSSVTIVGSLQSELGCAGDWDPACEATYMFYDGEDMVWQGFWDVPAGAWEYKAALDDSWDENYGLLAVRNGANIPLNLGSDTTVKFYYDHETHWITDNQTASIATAPGSYQSEIGCAGDWDPGCLRSWLQDSDGDGVYSFSTTAIPAGSYEFKVAIDESWDENYGGPGGANIPFDVPGLSMVTFYFDRASNSPSVQVISLGASLDNNVWWDGVRHDSRDLLYRTPGGAVPVGTPVILRLRTYHNDVTEVKLRLWDLNASAQQILPMERVAEDEGCYQADLALTCDYWAVTLPNLEPNNYWYRFIVTDGSDTDYYADNTPALDGGLGSVTDDVLDNSYALMVYDPNFNVPDWVQDAVIYQIFPDRFRDGRRNNNAHTGDVRYDDPVLALPWGTLPEGYCRNYDDAGINCPWRFDDDPPDWSPIIEGARGRDYLGGDLKGVDQNLEYLVSLGVNTLYFNPIFDSGSNHGYDTQDYYTIDPYFGTQQDWNNLVRHANHLGVRIIVDGVFNHMSSDSPLFDRYHHYPQAGACESLTSPYRDWFYFHDVTTGTGPCFGSAGPNSASYDSWFGFDSIPVLNKSNPEVQAYFLTNEDSVSRYWLEQGASGWRLDVMGDASFPRDYWQTFREVVEETDPEALIIGELWQKDSTLLRFLRGDRADTTMNYRLRDAVLGLLSTSNFDAKGFADSGRILSPSEFASRLASIQEDYPVEVFYSLMNLLDSHDTERILWALTPGGQTTADKELNPDNLAEGMQRQQLASLIQFSLPGAPTIFYGDEVAMTGDDDPDDRRTYPWADRGGSPDMDMFNHYQTLASLRQFNPVLTAGDLRILLADDATDTVAFGRKTGTQAAIIAVNRSGAAIDVSIPVAGYLPDGLTFHAAYGVENSTGWSVNVTGGMVIVALEPLSALLLLTDEVDLTPTATPTGLLVTDEGTDTVSLTWDATPGAVGYNLYRSPVTGGGFIQMNDAALTDLSFTDTSLRTAHAYFYVLTALDEWGNESAWSNEASAMPHYSIGWANLQWPPSIEHTISVLDPTDDVYGQVWIDAVTSLPGLSPDLRAQLGFGPDGSVPDGNPNWIWIEAGFNLDAGNNDEFMANMLPEAIGVYDYAYRYSTTDGRDWLYADLDGTGNGYDPAQAGSLTVLPSSDTTPPAAPTNLMVTVASPGFISLEWEAILGDPTIYGYEIARADNSGGPYTVLERVIDINFTDYTVTEGASYFYVVRSVDTSFNRSDYSDAVPASAIPRPMSVVFNVTVPESTDSTGMSVYIAGTLGNLDGSLPDWDPSGVVLTRVDATRWTITLSGLESTHIEYKYTLGFWDYVEKGESCVELSNRQLTLSYGTDGIQIVNDTVLNWRNIYPCGN